MGVNKVVYGAVTIIDISDSTVTPETLAQGIMAYDAKGEKITGTLTAGITPTGTITITENGTYDVTEYASAKVNVVSSGGMPSAIVAGDTPVLTASTGGAMITSSSMKASGVKIIIPIAGTYRFKWFSAKLTDSGLSGTYASRLYKNGTAQGTSQTLSGDNAYKSCSVDLTCAAGDSIEIYAQCRGSSYPTAVGNLTACIDWDNGF